MSAKAFRIVVTWALAPIFLALMLCPRAGAAGVPATQAASPAATQASGGEFMRFVDDGRGGGKLETAVVTFKNDAGVTVHLVAAVHIADRAYYRGLNALFTHYDVLLYEMVKPKHSGTFVPGTERKTGITALQEWLRDVLHLDFQLDDIDYRAANFVHADLDAETFAKMEDQRGESLTGLMLQQMIQQMMRQMSGQGAPAASQPTLLDWLAAAASPDRARQYKLLLARQFDQVEDSFSDVGGPNGTVLVIERNKTATRVLKSVIAEGKRNIGIFYGAAHMTDLRQRLLAMGFKQAGVPQWRIAWDLTDHNPTTGPYISPIDRLLQRIDATQPATGPANASSGK